MHSQIYVSYLRQQYSSSFHCWQSYDKQLVEENHLASFLSVLDTVNIFLIPSHFLLSLIQKKPTAAGTSSTLLSRAGLLPTPQLRRTTTNLLTTQPSALLVTSSLKNRATKKTGAPWGLLVRGVPPNHQYFETILEPIKFWHSQWEFDI